MFFREQKSPAGFSLNSLSIHVLSLESKTGTIECRLQIETSVRLETVFTLERVQYAQSNRTVSSHQFNSVRPDERTETHIRPSQSGPAQNRTAILDWTSCSSPSSSVLSNNGIGMVSMVPKIRPSSFGRFGGDGRKFRASSASGYKAARI